MTQSLHSIVRGTGTPILLIHGFEVDHRLLLPLESALDREHPWERCYVDIPGFGGSHAGPDIDSADAVADAVLGFVRNRYGTTRFALLGCSFGGQVARQLVGELGDQVLGLALLAPAVRPHGERTLPPKTVLTPDPELIARLNPDDAREYEAMAVVQDDANWTLFAESVLPGLRAYDRAAADRIRTRYSPKVVPETRFTTFDAPSVMITGRQDHVVGFVDQIELLPSYPSMSYAALDGAGHNVHLDRQAETHALLGGWLDRMEKKLG